MAEKTDDTVKIPGFTFRSINPPPSSTSSAPVPSDSGAAEAHSQSLFLPKIRGKKVVETPAFTLPFNASQNGETKPKIIGVFNILCVVSDRLSLYFSSFPHEANI